MRRQTDDGADPAHLGRELPHVPVRQWVLSLPFVQRYGGALNLNVHYHLLAIDGWFRRGDTGFEFVHAPAPKQRKVEALVLHVQARVMRLLAPEGMLDEGAEDPLGAEAHTLATCYAGAVTQRVGRGEGLLCAQVDGFDLHGRVAFGPHQRARVEQLVRYCARSPVAHDRLQKLPDGLTTCSRSRAAGATARLT